MNRFIDVLNRIRQNMQLSWLTPSQQRAYRLLCERLKFLDEVNLWGPHGVGKTFLGWILWAQGLAAYAPSLEHVEPSSSRPIVVVDNMDWRRPVVREALHRCRQLGYSKIILITTEPVRDQMATVEIALTDDDLAKAMDNLRSIGIAPYSETPRHLWDIVNPLKLNE